MASRNFLAFDLGAESGRAMIGAFDGDKLQLTEAHRFPNKPVYVTEHLHWNVLSLWDEMQTGLRKAASQFSEMSSIGVDTWGVDFALLDWNGDLIGHPYCYRDPRTDSMMDEAFLRVSRERIFEATGIQFMQLNTLYQLLATTWVGSPALEIADKFLMMPDLFNYFLTGITACEFSNATTTQFYDPRAGDWARELLDALEIPHNFLPNIIPPGTDLGNLSRSVLHTLDARALNNAHVIAPASHDTGSAVAGVPASTERYAYISSGTWSLLGAVVREPVITPQALQFNFTNEGGVAGTFRLLKNIAGLWLVQECRRKWTAESGAATDYAELLALAERVPSHAAFVDPDDSSFLHPDDMPWAIMDYSSRTGQSLSANRGELLRCVLESLALKYRYVLEQLEALLGHTVEVIHIVGGGSQNKLLCQFTADACNRLVLAGPVEATAIGNLIVQMVACGELHSMDDARTVTRRSFPVTTYEPRNVERWADAYGRFTALIDSSGQSSGHFCGFSFATNPLLCPYTGRFL